MNVLPRSAALFSLLRYCRRTRTAVRSRKPAKKDEAIAPVALKAGFYLTVTQQLKFVIDGSIRCSIDKLATC